MKHIIALLFITLLAGAARADALTPVQQGGTAQRHAQKVELLKKEKFDLFMIGDSITHTLDHFGGKYTPLEQVWQKYYVPRNAINLGYSGARTENILWNLRNGELDGQSPKVAVLLIGTNNTDDRRFKSTDTPEQIRDATRAIIDLIREKCPGTKILILRIFPRGGDDQKGVGDGVFHSSTNCVQAAADAGKLTEQLADGKTVFWLDVGPVFLNPDGTINTRLMPDLLHPNAAGAEAWARAIQPTLTELMGEPAVREPAPAK